MSALFWEEYLFIRVTRAGCVLYKNMDYGEKYMDIELQKDANGKELGIRHLLKKNANEYWFAGL